MAEPAGAAPLEEWFGGLDPAEHEKMSAYRRKLYEATGFTALREDRMPVLYATLMLATAVASLNEDPALRMGEAQFLKLCRLSFRATAQFSGAWADRLGELGAVVAAAAGARGEPSS